MSSEPVQYPIEVAGNGRLISIIKEVGNRPTAMRPPIVALYDLWLTQFGLAEATLRKCSTSELVLANRKIDALAKDPLSVQPNRASGYNLADYRPNLLELLFDRKRLVVDLILASALSSPKSPNKYLLMRNQRAQMANHKLALWRTLLAKESVATIVGAYLLVLLSGAMVTAVFAKVQMAEVMTSSFLLVLGYFFGHGVSSRTAKRSM